MRHRALQAVEKLAEHVIMLDMRGKHLAKKIADELAKATRACKNKPGARPEPNGHQRICAGCLLRLRETSRACLETLDIGPKSSRRALLTWACGMHHRLHSTLAPQVLLIVYVTYRLPTDGNGLL